MGDGRPTPCPPPPVPVWLRQPALVQQQLCRSSGGGGGGGGSVGVGARAGGIAACVAKEVVDAGCQTDGPAHTHVHTQGGRGGALGSRGADTDPDPGYADTLDPGSTLADVDSDSGCVVLLDPGSISTCVDPDPGCVGSTGHRYTPGGLVLYRNRLLSAPQLLQQLLDRDRELAAMRTARPGGEHKS